MGLIYLYFYHSYYHHHNALPPPKRHFYIGCGRKNSPIWEANKFKTKEDTANVFLFLERTQIAVLHQRVLNKLSLNWRPWILVDWCSLSVGAHDLENHFMCNGSNFLSYHLLQSFQSLSCLSKVWYPTVNRFLIRNNLPSTKRKADAKCTLCCYRRPVIFINSSTINARYSSNHAMVYFENGTYTAVRWRTFHYCKRSPPEAMTLPNWGILSAALCIWLPFVTSCRYLDERRGPRQYDKQPAARQ